MSERKSEWQWQRKGCRVTDRQDKKVADVSVARCDEAELNRRGNLIASAPDLLEALEEAETWMFRVSDEILDGEGSRQQYTACRERIRAAIARAQGKG